MPADPPRCVQSQARFCPAAILLPHFEREGWNREFRAVIFFLAMLYFFQGVMVVTSVFMSSIEVITSRKKTRPAKSEVKIERGIIKVRVTEQKREKVWNETVANLTLVAFGTAAPEICLSIYELVGHDFRPGKLGPSLIIGAAAYHLLIVTSICMVSLPGTETRRIKHYRVYAVTAVFAVIAYLWLFVILNITSERKVDLWEASVTMMFFPLMVYSAYVTDKRFEKRKKARQKTKSMVFTISELAIGKPTDESVVKSTDQPSGKSTDPPKLTSVVPENPKLFKLTETFKTYKGILESESHIASAAEMTLKMPQTQAWHTINAIQSLTGGRKLFPNFTSNLTQALNQNNKLVRAFKPLVDRSRMSYVEFDTPIVAVSDSVRQLSVPIKRHGMTDQKVSVRVTTNARGARENQDYVPVNEIVTFEEGQTVKKIALRIANASGWKLTEGFHLQLSVLPGTANSVTLGGNESLHIENSRGHKPGVISFAKSAIAIREGIGTLKVSVKRTNGSYGNVSVKWRTIDHTAILNEHYLGEKGTLYFRSGEVHKSIKIPIIKNPLPNPDLVFDIELREPRNGATLGVYKCSVTILDEDQFNTKVNLLVHTMNDFLDIRVETATWVQQIKEAMTVGGGVRTDPKTIDYFLHFFSFFWKVIFSLLPPPHILGGWPTFFTSLVCIGIVTAVIGDLATIFGCLVGLDDTVTAITLVALGTSLPDTLAARTVTISERVADGSLVHLNGSMAINVFMGVGLPWFIGVWYHRYNGSEFEVNNKGLLYNVSLFIVAATIAFSILIFRRQFLICGKAELGGPLISNRLTAATFVVIWLLYVTLTWLEIGGKIQLF